MPHHSHPATSGVPPWGYTTWGSVVALTTPAIAFLSSSPDPVFPPTFPIAKVVMTNPPWLLLFRFTPVGSFAGQVTPFFLLTAVRLDFCVQFVFCRLSDPHMPGLNSLVLPPLGVPSSPQPGPISLTFFSMPESPFFHILPQRADVSFFGFLLPLFRLRGSPPCWYEHGPSFLSPPLIYVFARLTPYAKFCLTKAIPGLIFSAGTISARVLTSMLRFCSFFRSLPFITTLHFLCLLFPFRRRNNDLTSGSNKIFPSYFFQNVSGR